MATRRISRAWIHRSLMVVLAGIVTSGCDRAEHEPRAAGSAASGFEHDAVLPHRAEVVARADALAVSGAQRGGAAGAELLRRAAELRIRIWRLERREADALEALELLRASAAADWPLSCESGVDHALLEAELRGDTARAYRALYVLRQKQGGRCRDRAERALTTLAAFKPMPVELAELDRQLAADNGSRTAAKVALSAKGNGELSGPVVVPKVDAAARREPVRITSIERYGAQDAARIVVFVTHPTVFEAGFVAAAGDRGPRVFVDIDNSTYKGQANFDVGGLVERVRLGQQNRATRVVLDLTQAAYRTVSYLPEPFRLVIDVSKQPPPSAVQAGAGPRKIGRVVLDPGHGGHDPGALGPSGLREKDVTIDIALRAAPLIARELGITTLLTRKDDVYVPLDERTHRANAFNADLFISIHCNASEDPSGHGVMTFVLDASKDALAARTAARENAASPAATAELANAISLLPMPTRVASEQFAGLLQKSSMSSLVPGYAEVTDRGVRRAGFYVLVGARMPAVLFEMSFISNPLGELRLNTSDYRQKMADAIVNAIRAYRDGL